MIKAFKNKIKTWLRPCPRHYDFLPTHLALSQRPPSPFARYTAITLSIGIIIALLWAYLGKLDVQATATGRLIVSGRSQIIQAYEQSRVTAIHVQNGQRVKKDAPLLTLNTLGVNQDITRLLKQIEYQAHEKIRYQALTEEQEPTEQELFQALPASQQTQVADNYSREKREYEAVVTNLKAEMNVNLSSQQSRKSDINALTKLRQNISQRLKARQTLSQKQVISKVEYLEQEKEFLETERLIAQQNAELHVLQSQYISLEERLNSLKTQKEREWFDKRKQAEVQLVVLEQELAKAQIREQLEVIRSPVTGTVQQLSVHTLGAVLQPAQNLMVIVPDDNVQLAEVQILNKDAGFVYPGQLVTVKVDAFPYTRYGTIDGELLSISRDSTTDERLGLVFPAQVSLKSNSIAIDDTQVEITPGMSIVAEIKTDQRRVIDYLLSPIREYQSEALREK
ncbi:MULTISPECIES: HlyD family type I secretion periplasmic adaptor subunit [Photorhabdus]|uniref:Membrane fusion protein (MFP) family protein n=1 Tax=Photorhabdus bodei TaxID=2029681 RepID=A0A329X927_9GAMM|nr:MULTISPECIES: HlyD family type I secretion periplasmic adaptor subunit [Photorhabdus]MCT8343182.1 HlyD family type I secretion periplasmic adaptor subunit [Photorhabdus kleinii]NDK98103.1 HlyD family type I secretion periplasmic adaptor subunit [Photorhabdus bodei]NDL02353.1 HlyD family type I secretion periplasmic adaptor subunit [Photorhabdus bodei]NDL06427.1 HlyD family type I secretion periplasmic adaptor subunit [Photorhabdus bodei]RAW97425.1 hemolysin D [Photorhabdus sp. S10-54]